MSDTTYHLKPGRVDRIGPDRPEASLQEDDPEVELVEVGDELDESDLWAEETTEVTKLHEELETHLSKVERRLNGIASKADELRYWAALEAASG